MVPQVRQSQTQGEYSFGAMDTLAVRGTAGHSAKVRAPPRPLPSRTTPHSASSALPIWFPSDLLPLLPVYPSLQPHWAMGTASSASHEVSWPSLLQETSFPHGPPVQIHPSLLVVSRAAELGLKATRGHHCPEDVSYLIQNVRSSLHPAGL